MCKFSKKLIYLLFALVLFIPAVKADDNKLPVRVGISNTNFKTYLFDNIVFLNAKKMNVMDSASGYTIPISETAEKIKVTTENNLFRVYIDNVLLAKNIEGPILIRPKEGFFVEIEGLTGKTAHAWNGVMIEGKWRLLDVTWAGNNFSFQGIDDDKSYKRALKIREKKIKSGRIKNSKKIKNEWFLSNPKKFYETHKPYDSKWTLIK